MNGDSTDQPDQTGRDRPAPEPEQQPEPQNYEDRLPDGEDYDETDEEELMPSMPPIIWEAHEFVNPTKTSRWYMYLSGITVAAAVAIYFITKDTFSAGTVILAGAMLAVVASRKPKEVTYQIDDHGIKAGQKQYKFENFRSFALLKEHASNSIVLHPLQRFMPLVTLYYNGEDEDRIVDALTTFLPLEDRDHDLLDRFLQKIKL